MRSLIDLHCHSTVSDGVLTPSEVVHHAAEQGVRVLALTDHDDVTGLSTARAVAQTHCIQFIDGVEISVTWRRRTLHIVGLKINPEYPPLLEGLASIRAGRHTRAEGMAHALEKIGIHGVLEGAYAHSKGGIISRTHFARFLIEQGYAKDTKAVFKHYLVKGKPGYFEHQWASLEDAMAWIIGSGGVAVIAHPGRYDLGRVTMLELMHEFRALGGAAIEVVTGSHSVDQYQTFAHMAKQFDLASSMGSDYHGKGQTYIEMGRLPSLPSQCVPVWHDWPEVQGIELEIH
jgi:predicted metal-dependent phosphoesterase TrpH